MIRSVSVFNGGKPASASRRPDVIKSVIQPCVRKGWRVTVGRYTSYIDVRLEWIGLLRSAARPKSRHRFWRPNWVELLALGRRRSTSASSGRKADLDRISSQNEDTTIQIRSAKDRLLHRSVKAASRELKTGLNIYLTIDFEPV
jgi:hypothetical protein